MFDEFRPPAAEITQGEKKAAKMSPSEKRSRGAGARHVDNVYQYVAFSSSVVVAQAYVAQHDTWQKSG